MMNLFRRLSRKPHGASAAEYMVMLILAALFIIAIIRVFGGTVSSKLYVATNKLDNLEAQEKANKENGGNGSGGENGSGQGVNGANGNGSGNGANGANGANGSGSGKNGNGGSGSGKNGKGGKGGKKDGKGGVGSDKKGGSAGPAIGPDGKPLEEEEDSGINPLVLLIAMGLIGLLFYSMSKNKG